MVKKIKGNDAIYELVKEYLLRGEDDKVKKMLWKKCTSNKEEAKNACKVISNVAKILCYFKAKYSEEQLKNVNNARLHIITEIIKINAVISGLSGHERVLYEHFAIWFLLNDYKYKNEADKYTDRLEYYFFSVIPTFFPGEGDLAVYDMLAQILDRLDTRFNRLVHLKQLNAPEDILGNEYGMIFTDVYMLLYGNKKD